MVKKKSTKKIEETIKTEKIENKEIENDEIENPLVDETNFENPFNNFFDNDEENEISTEEACIHEMFSDKDIEKKTELEKPTKFASIETFAEHIETKNKPKSALLLKTFVKKVYTLSVSKGRLGRKEIVQIFQSVIQNQQIKEQKEEKKELKPL